MLIKEDGHKKVNSSRGGRRLIDAQCRKRPAAWSGFNRDIQSKHIHWNGDTRNKFHRAALLVFTWEGWFYYEVFPVPAAAAPNPIAK